MPTITTTTTPSSSHLPVTQHEAELFAPLSTLDEPIRETIMRDVRSVASKLKVVLLPMERSVRLFSAGYKEASHFGHFRKDS